MKKAYSRPMARKVDYAFTEQIAASSYPLSNYADPWEGGKCTYGDSNCSLVYNVATSARGLYDCLNPGYPPLG